MTPKARVFWNIVLLTAALSVLLWCYDHRIQEQTRVKLENLAQARRQLSALSAQANRQIAEDQTLVAEAPRAKATEGPLSYLWPRPSQGLHDNPKLQSAYVAAKRASLASSYGPLFRKLHLSPQESQALGELIMHREENVFDTAAAAPSVFTSMAESAKSAMTRLVINPDDPATYSAGRLPPDPPPQDETTQAAVALLRQAIERFNASAAALSGADSFKVLREFERTLPLQPQMREFASVLALASQPLNLVQVDALSEALAQATPSYRQGGDAIPQSIDWDEASASLSSILTPAQQAVLRYRLAYLRENMHFFRQLERL